MVSVRVALLRRDSGQDYSRYHHQLGQISALHTLAFRFGIILYQMRRDHVPAKCVAMSMSLLLIQGRQSRNQDFGLEGV